MTKSVEELEKELDELKSEFRGYVQKKNEEEKKKLHTALLAAGGIILALGSFIWWEIIWPVVKAGSK